MTKAFCIAFVMTFFPVLDVPVFWPILLCYCIVLFVHTMRRLIGHMMKYKYIPFSIGKQVILANLFSYRNSPVRKVLLVAVVLVGIESRPVRITTYMIIDFHLWRR
ncbi:hypothetical protein Gogos_012401 [Gossypium gossypioides]|uniref:Uncharacterized protein n=1 Tax=Gossypium gossypioides TaxID=34282 RepID=A0A7J9BSR0_GOSGO|nr:hypothetical protein [Gossypium gossypioides]